MLQFSYTGRVFRITCRSPPQPKCHECHLPPVCTHCTTAAGHLRPRPAKSLPARPAERSPLHRYPRRALPPVVVALSIAVGCLHLGPALHLGAQRLQQGVLDGAPQPLWHLRPPQCQPRPARGVRPALWGRQTGGCARLSRPTGTMQHGTPSALFAGAAVPNNGGRPCSTEHLMPTPSATIAPRAVLCTTRSNMRTAFSYHAACNPDPTLLISPAVHPHAALGAPLFHSMQHPTHTQPRLHPTQCTRC